MTFLTIMLILITGLLLLLAGLIVKNKILAALSIIPLSASVLQLIYLLLI
ncbi:hypothetical protein QGM71_19790 [Virgibacillus sp. C22-A2]|uniref:Uncharacterized protein n=1 Tax=Virgibacillus tibetensis TaxID=3042313 RepID=A0ABU6KLF0_9BACI|nr:hypothetical protein [Virgibacillus sp. C22-A2]